MTKLLTGLAILGLGTTVGVTCCAISAADNPVALRAQLNVIVWDPETKTQHFVRNATFGSGVGHLSFIAPSPTVPELAEADPAVFKTLRKIKKVDTLANSPIGCAADLAPAAMAKGVSVLHTRTVAGYEAAVLKANDPVALGQWLKKNGYTMPDDIRDWLKFYVDKEWILTAFKVAIVGGEAETGLVRMSFKTDQPFNPYFVPKSNQEGVSTLGVYFISDERYVPDRIGRDATLAAQWSAQVPSDLEAQIAKEIGIKGLPMNAHLTYLNDSQFPNPHSTDDLWFKKSPEPWSLPMWAVPWVGLAVLIGGLWAFVKALKWLLGLTKGKL